MARVIPACREHPVKKGYIALQGRTRPGSWREDLLCRHGPNLGQAQACGEADITMDAHQRPHRMVCHPSLSDAPLARGQGSRSVSDGASSACDGRAT